MVSMTILIRAIHDWYVLKTVSFSVKCDCGLTYNFNAPVGVKQGCILSPFFFNVFLGDLPSIFDNTYISPMFVIMQMI